MAITWQDDLATGIEVVDIQHKEIFSRFDAFSDAFDQGVALGVLTELLLFLERYTQQHFWDEEDYMAGSRYPELAEHKIAHRTFLDDLTRLQADVRGDDTNSRHIMVAKRLLILWFIKHIRVSDKEFASYLSRRS